MTQTATYTLVAFVDDVKQIFASSKDPLVQAQGVANQLKQLLAIPGCLTRYVHFAWWLIMFPGAAIFVTVTTFNLVGEGLRDALDPRLRE